MKAWPGDVAVDSQSGSPFWPEVHHFWVAEAEWALSGMN